MAKSKTNSQKFAFVSLAKAGEVLDRRTPIALATVVRHADPRTAKKLADEILRRLDG